MTSVVHPTDSASPGDPREPLGSRYRRLRLRGLVLWPLAATVAVGLVALVPPRTGFGAAVTAAFLAVYVALLLAGVFAARRADIPLSSITGALPSPGRPWLTAAALGPLVLALSAATMWALVWLASDFFPQWAGDQLAGDDDSAALVGRLDMTQRYVLALIAVVVAPVVEEFVFRGLLLRRWIARRGFWRGLLGTAGVFALLHPPNWIGAFAFSVVAGILYLWSGSLALPILVHVVNNAFVALALLAQQLAPAQNQPPPSVADFQANWLGPLLLLLVTGGLTFAVARPLLRGAQSRAAEQAGTGGSSR